MPKDYGGADDDADKQAIKMLALVVGIVLLLISFSM